LLKTLFRQSLVETKKDNLQKLPTVVNRPISLLPLPQPRIRRDQAIVIEKKFEDK
jgi:hypothetical protein